MNKDEFNELIKEIKLDYAHMQIENKEWWKKLEPYAYEDVMFKYETHKNGQFSRTNPQLFRMYKGLIPEDNKINTTITCQYCGKEFKYPEFKDEEVEHSRTHLRKNNLLRYLSYWNVELKQDLNTMHDNDFNRDYRRMLNKVLEYNEKQPKLKPLEKIMIEAIIKDDEENYKTAILNSGYLRGNIGESKDI